MKIALCFVAVLSLVAGVSFANGEIFGGLFCLVGAAINFKNLWDELSDRLEQEQQK